ncbi:PE-PGRS family protein [Paraconexibacter sp. AEG42_29]|uniref:PE-PGRS family protein n=1 Tax=Paraconexibacter sp. AEG42_29 TaxID=2997339 RepID=UPI00339D890C
MAAVVAGCGDGSGTPAAPPTTSVRPAGTGTAAPSAPAARPPALCRPGRPVTLGRLRDPALDELSGLARSRRNPSVLFANEDSGAAPVLTVARTDGTVLGTVSVTGAEAVDWEDIASGRGPDDRAVLFVADIGDNAAARSSVQVYRLAEPGPAGGATGLATRLDLRYPDGPHDAEALLADPLRRELVIVTKALGGGRAYTVPASVAGGDATAGTTTLRRGPAIDLGWVTAGDVSGDGRVVALRTYTSLAVWQRQGREPLATTLARSPTCRADVDLAGEGQGESLALDRSGRTALTAPEGAAPLLRRYGRPGTRGR